MDTRLFEKHVKDVVRELRERIAKETSKPNVLFKVMASGRVHEGDFKITFHVENQYDSECNVSGGDLDAVIAEYIRRNYWHEAHAPLCLPPVKAVQEISDERVEIL